MGASRRSSTALEAFNDLEAFLARSAKAHASLPELEWESERRGREVCRLALQAHLDTRGHGDVGAALVLGGADGPVRLTHKRLHARRLLTIFGEVTVTRVGYGPEDSPPSTLLTPSCACPGAPTATRSAAGSPKPRCAGLSPRRSPPSPR